MKRVAFVFPGQGSQAVGMGLDLYEESKEARAVIDAAHDALSGEVNLRELLFEADKDKLALTENTQPAVLTLSLALHAELIAQSSTISPVLVAGHSLGEYSALTAAGAMELVDAVRVVRKRGLFMQQAIPVGAGSMAAVVGLDSDLVVRCCEEATLQVGAVVSAANFNSLNQTVISGDVEAVERASSLVREAGARRVLKLPVSAPFHCELLAPARERLSYFLNQMSFKKPAPPFVSNVDALPVDDPERIPDLLTRQVTSPVLWVDIVRLLRSKGVSDVIEIGPGRVLSGLIKGIDDSINCHHLGSCKEIEALLNHGELV